MRALVFSGFILTLLIGGSLLLKSCKQHDLPYTPAQPIPFSVPPGFPNPTYDFNGNPVTEPGFQLGKKLFYDGILSRDGNFPCASCHQPIAAFTTFEHDRSHGYNNSHTLRNAPSLQNLAWTPLLKQDGSTSSLKDLIRNHITASDEMAETMNSVVNKLKANVAYRGMFRDAFGTETITQDQVLDALRQFVVSMTSANAKYDKMKRGEVTFTAEEASGYATFQQKCESCHKEPLFTDNSFRNTGLPADPVLKDFGRFRVTGNPADSFKFRVPSLRNLDLNSYYGHDGRMSVFRMMIIHYRSGVQPFTNVDPAVKNGIPISPTEENNLVAFLRTLTDSSFIKNPRYVE